MPSRSIRALLALALAVLFSSAVVAQTRPAASTTSAKFSFYLLSLSWSPQYCWDVGAGGDEPQCDPARHYGFVVHGLWPQNESGPNPRSCKPNWKLDAQVATSMLDIMPSRQLVEHEWGAHGTCSGLQPVPYFQLARQAAQRFKIPARYQNPSKPQVVKLAAFREELRQANPGLPADGFALYCDSKALREIRVCMDKDLKFRSCGARVHDACGLSQILLRATVD